MTEFLNGITTKTAPLSIPMPAAGVRLIHTLIVSTNITSEITIKRGTETILFFRSKQDQLRTISLAKPVQQTDTLTVEMDASTGQTYVNVIAEITHA